MIDLHVWKAYSVAVVIRRLETGIEAGIGRSGSGLRLSEFFGSDGLSTDEIPEANSDGFFPSVVDQFQRLRKLLEEDATIGEYLGAVRSLRERLEDEMQRHWLFWVPPNLVGYYNSPALFGVEVNDRFPSAIDDIESAGKCLALGQGTACVLHSMRVMEVGLRALSKALGIPYAPSWESHLQQIQKKVAEKHRTKGIQWKRDQPFFLEVSGDLISIKQAWRNPTMHVGRKYGTDEAEEIFKAVRTLMRRLATRFSE